MNQFEMQQALQRFTGLFLNRIMDAGAPLIENATEPRIQQEALNRIGLYYSSALDVASGPLPEVNVLDMIVYLTLSRTVLERYWKPQVFGPSLDPLIAAFRTSEEDLWELASTVLDQEQKETLKAVIDDWIEKHPDSVRVEMVRFSEFSEHAGEVAAEMAQKAQGLLGSVRGATQLANQALLLGERAMFLANRMPFVVRFQARLGAKEIVGDSLRRTSEITELLEQLPNPEPMIRDLTHLTVESRGLVRDAREAAATAKPLLGDQSLTAAIDSTNRLANTSLALAREIRAIKPADPGALAANIEAQADRMMRRFIGYLALAGVICSSVFWAGYYVVKRASAAPRMARAR